MSVSSVTPSGQLSKLGGFDSQRNGYVFPSGVWGASSGSSTPIVSYDSPFCIYLPNSSWMNKHWPIFRRIILFIPVLARGIRTLWILSDFLQYLFLSPGWEVIRTIPRIVNKFLLLKLKKKKKLGGFESPLKLAIGVRSQSSLRGSAFNPYGSLTLE